MAGAGGAAAGAAGLAVGQIIRIIGIILGVLGGAGIGLVIVGGVLVMTGNPKPCADRQIPVSPAAAQALKEKWDAFAAQAAGGPANVTFNESEVTSRGVEYLNEKDVPLNDLQVYLCPDGYGEATGTINALGRDINVLIRGTLDLSADQPRIDVEKIEAGNLPSGVGTTIVNQILDRSGVKNLDVDVNITGISFADAEATLEGGPQAP